MKKIPLNDCIDARVWAEEFNITLVKKGIQPFDPGLMIAWFANSIMAGSDEQYRRDKQKIQSLKFTIDKFDSIHTKIQRQSYSFTMANDIRNILKEFV